MKVIALPGQMYAGKTSYSRWTTIIQISGGRRYAVNSKSKSHHDRVELLNSIISIYKDHYSYDRIDEKDWHSSLDMHESLQVMLIFPLVER